MPRSSPLTQQKSLPQPQGMNENRVAQSEGTGDRMGSSTINPTPFTSTMTQSEKVPTEKQHSVLEALNVMTSTSTNRSK